MKSLCVGNNDILGRHFDRYLIVTISLLQTSTFFGELFTLRRYASEINILNKIVVKVHRKVTNRFSYQRTLFACLLGTGLYLIFHWNDQLFILFRSRLRLDAENYSLQTLKNMKVSFANILHEQRIS